MKIHRLDAHDRLGHFKNQGASISVCCQNMIDQRPFGEHAFYIYAHPRTVGLDEKLKLFIQGGYPSFDGIPEKRIIWQPRLTKPEAQPNSMLFKAKPGSDNIKIIWMIPPPEMWDQYKKGKLTESHSIYQSIQDFQHNRGFLEKAEPDDLSDHEINIIYRELSRDANMKKKGTNGIV